MAGHALIYSSWPFSPSPEKVQVLVDFLRTEGVLGAPRGEGVWEAGPVVERLGVTVHGHVEVEVSLFDRPGLFGGESFEPICPRCREVAEGWPDLMTAFYETGVEPVFECPTCEGGATPLTQLPILGGGAPAGRGAAWRSQ